MLLVAIALQTTIQLCMFLVCTVLCVQRLLASISVASPQDKMCPQEHIECSSTWHNAFVDIFHDSFPLLPQLWRL